LDFVAKSTLEKELRLGYTHNHVRDYSKIERRKLFVIAMIQSWRQR